MKEWFRMFALWMRVGANAKHLSSELQRLDAELAILRSRHQRLSKEVSQLELFADKALFHERGWRLRRVEEQGNLLLEERNDTAVMLGVLLGKSEDVDATKTSSPPQLGERLLLLLLTKEERANIPGDLEEEFKQIAAKHGAQYAKLWYYKQVAASAWPLVRKAVRWGVLALVGEWIRRGL